ncbi:hypothetical protein GGS20DRAFT_526859 [Poronia punctata]|nr:hypothetical protein GGS20DRAFT_526859 [Poronia punctata]
MSVHKGKKVKLVVCILWMGIYYYISRLSRQLQFLVTDELLIYHWMGWACVGSSTFVLDCVSVIQGQWERPQPKVFDVLLSLCLFV